MRNFTGVGVALVTPFDEHGDIDEISLRKLVGHVIEGGVDFLVPLGTTGESTTMNAAEKAEVIRIIAGENRGRLPLMAGIGGNNTATVVQELHGVSWLNECQGVLSVVPYYNKPSQQGLYEHFQAIAEASPLPVYLYNIPGRSGVNMNASTIISLSQNFPNIAGIKEASGNFEQATAILKMKGPDFITLSGDDGIVLPLMAMGFDGVISVLANAFPGEMVAMVRAIQTGDYATARRIHLKLSDLCHALFEEGNPTGIKAVLYQRGIIRSNKLRLPLVSGSGSLAHKLSEILRTL